MRTFCCLNCILVILVVLQSPAAAHPYLPLIEGAKSELDYSFKIETSQKQFKTPDTNGVIRVEAEKFKEKSGKQYLNQITSYEGISYMKEKTSIFRREDSAGVYMAYEEKGTIKETLELPATVEVGTEWEYDDGEKSMRKVTAKIEIKLPSGEMLNDCIEVSRKVLNKPSLGQATDKNVYCKDIGKVHSIFIQPSPLGDYKTETILRSIKASF